MLQPSRRDNGSAPRDAADIRALVRHLVSYVKGLDPGYLGGNFATPQPVPAGSTLIVGGEEDGGDGTSAYEWQWDDRGIVTATGTQHIGLTYEPIEESLVVRWHPNGRGALTLTNEHYTLVDRTVIITDPGFLAVNDQFSFQYQFDPTVESDETFELVASLTGQPDLAGTWGTTSIPISDLAEHGAGVGDFFVVAISGPVAGSPVVSSSDSRIEGSVAATAYMKVYWGHLDSLADFNFAIAAGSSPDRRAWAVAVYSGAHEVTATATNTATFSAVMTVPSLTIDNDALAVFFVDTSTGGSALPNGVDTTGEWARDASIATTTPISAVGIHRLANPGAFTTTPAGSIDAAEGIGVAADAWYGVALKIAEAS